MPLLCLSPSLTGQMRTPQAETALPPEPDHAARYSLGKVTDPRWHGDSGPIAKSYSLHFAFGPLHNRILEAVQTLGVPYNTEPVCICGPSPGLSFGSVVSGG